MAMGVPLMMTSRTDVPGRHSFGRYTVALDASCMEGRHAAEARGNAGLPMHADSGVLERSSHAAHADLNTVACHWSAGTTQQEAHYTRGQPDGCHLDFLYVCALLADHAADMLIKDVDTDTIGIHGVWLHVRPRAWQEEEEEKGREEDEYQ